MHRPALFVTVGAAVIAAATPRPAAAQDTGALAGTVVDELTLERLEGVRIAVLGAGPQATSDRYGQFLLDSVPIGSISVRISADGYVTAVEQIEVADTDFLQIRLSPVAAALDELLVLARGRRDGSVVRSDPAGLESSRSALDVLADDVPGVLVRRGGGDLGTGAAIAIRGVGTFGNASPDVYLDGVRIDERSGGSRAANVLDLIPAETVARIRVFKGPSAAAPFALGANGVILVETLRGRGPGE